MVASNMKEEMEAKIKKAAEENNILKGQLEESCQHIQKQSSQLQVYKSRMETWRSKFAKFRSFLNELGCDFQSLQHKRGELSKVESQNDLLKQSLKDAEERSNYLLTQLSDEKKRSSLLEVYIQNCARAQSTKLDKIMSHQPIIHAFAARMDSAMHQLDAGIARGTEATAGLTESLKAQTEIIGKHVVSENQLVAKISKDSETNESLRNALRELAAANEDINVSMKGLEARESGLLDQFTALEASLSAMQLPDQRQILKEETQRFEQTLAEMERKIQSLSEQSKLAEEALRNKDLENQALRGSLETASAKVEDDDSRVRRCEAEVATLKDEVKSVEARVRKELSRASVVSREQDRARYEQKIHELLRGKSEIERNLSKVSMQLAETRRDLMLREDKMKQRVNELELLLGSKEKENERLKNDLSEITSKLEEEKHEAARLEEVASSSAAEQASLQHQIEEAAHRISCLEGECSRISKEGSKSIENIESKHDMLCKELQKKEDECVLIQSQLKATISEKAELECSKGRAAEEIKSLLRRVQNSEKWMNKLKATLGQAGLVTPDQPASEAWSSLETSLRTVISRDAACNSLNSSPGGNQDVGGSKARSSTLGQDVYKATEVIYKAEKNDAAKQSFCSAQNPNIVPFSSFRQRSPTDSSVFGNDQDDLAAMLLLTSEQQVPNEVHSVNKPVEAQSTGSASVAVSAKSKVLQPDPQDMNDEKALETKCSTRGTATKSKGVTFEAQSTASPGQKRKLSARSNISPSQWRSQSIEDRPARLNRRTYARARQPATRTLANLEEQSTCLPRNEIADEAAHATASCSIGSKRAKASVDQKPQTKPVSEYFERKPSPKKLASGSSRPSSLNASQGTNLKRAARGDHYNARFSRGA
ncbi:rootletin [Aspergillus luchuensis IFO 4308]|nr:rootletin [Aspergillus luchuensis IFO 4308]